MTDKWAWDRRRVRDRIAQLERERDELLAMVADTRDIEALAAKLEAEKASGDCARRELAAAQAELAKAEQWVDDETHNRGILEGRLAAAQAYIAKLEAMK